MPFPTLPGLFLERRGPVGWLIFDRPEAGNAMDADMLDALPVAWAALESSPEVDAIVVTGNGRAFQTGLDVRQLAGNPDALRAMSRRTRRGEPGLTGWHLGVTKPVIAALNGVCAGGGLHFVVDADLVLAAPHVTFLDPHVSVGQTSSYESIGLARRGAFGQAARLALLGVHERIGVERARQLGWVGEIVPLEALRDRAQELGEWLAAEPAGVTLRKRMLWRAMETGLGAARVVA